MGSDCGSDIKEEDFDDESDADSSESSDEDIFTN